MKITGNLNFLKKEIEENFDQQFEEFKEEADAAFKEEAGKIKEQHDADLMNAKSEASLEEKKVFRTRVAEELIKAKKSFEQSREGMINEVFERAEKKVVDIVEDKDYIDKVKAFTKGKKVKLIGGSMVYKKSFPSIEVDSKLQGIIVEEGDEIFDFTYGAFLESRKNALRDKISKVLF